jgi:hypothetical protein
VRLRLPRRCFSDLRLDAPEVPPQQRSSPSLSASYSSRSIEGALQCLNGRSSGRFEGVLGQVVGIDRTFDAYKTELQSYVDSWIKSGCDSTRWWENNPAVADRLQHTVDKHLRILLIPDPSGPATQTWLSRSTVDLRRRSSPFALLDFAQLLCSPLGKDIRRCPRCLLYFLNKSGHRKKVYCKRRCATNTSAETTTRARREREREERLARANRTLKAWILNPHGQDWKPWVAKRTRLTIKWLTRAVNKGDLHPPKIRKGE